MKRSGIGKMALVAAAALVAAGGWALAQQDQPTSQISDLSIKQRITKEQFEELTKTMTKLAGILETKGDAASANALREAVKAAQAAFISKDMEAVIEALNKGLSTKAGATEAQVIAKLREVLDALRRAKKDDEGYLDRLKTHLADVQNIKKDQDKLKNESKATTQGADPDKAAADFAKEVADLATAQKELMDKTKAAVAAVDPNVQKLLELRKEVRGLMDDQDKTTESVKTAPIDKLPVAGAVQDKVADRTGAVSKKIDDASKDAGLNKAVAAAGADPNAVAQAAGHASSAAKNMQSAASALKESEPGKAEQPQAKAGSDLRQADKALTAAIEKMTAGSKAGDLENKQKDLENKANELASKMSEAASAAGMPPPGQSGQPGQSGKSGQQPSSLQKAAQAMAQAGQKLAQQDPNAAVPHQEDAVKALEGTKYELAQLHRWMKENPPRPTTQQAEDQKKAEAKTDELTKDMEKTANQAGKPTPGQQPAQSAKGQMSKAGQKMSQGNPSGANEDQKKASEDLKKAEDDLQQAIADEEQKKQQAELEKMLKIQQAISADTKTAHEKILSTKESDKAELRTAELKLTTELSPGEGKLADDAQKVMDMLIKEGTTVVFPSVLGEVKKDLLDVQKKLAGKEAGTLTQAIQHEIEQNLQEMVRAVRDKLAENRDKKSKGGGGGQGGGGGGKPPLVPPVAELKMLRVMQLQVNGRTELVHKQAAENTLPKDQVEKETKGLAQREANVKKLTDGIAEKMRRGAPPPPPDR